MGARNAAMRSDWNAEGALVQDGHRLVRRRKHEHAERVSARSDAEIMGRHLF